MNWNFHWATSQAAETFWAAIQSGDVDTVRTIAADYLLQHHADPGREDYAGRIPQEVAEAKGRTEIVNLLKAHVVKHGQWGQSTTVRG